MMESPTTLQLLIEITATNSKFWIAVAAAISLSIATVSLLRLGKVLAWTGCVIAFFVLIWSSFEYLLTASFLTIQITDHGSALLPAGAVETDINNLPNNLIWKDSPVTLDDYKKHGDNNRWHVTVIRATYNEHAGANNVLVKLINVSGDVAVVYAEGPFVNPGENVNIMILSTLTQKEWATWETTEPEHPNRDRILKTIIGRTGLIRPYECSKWRNIVIALCAVSGLLYLGRFVQVLTIRQVKR
jgi:hypothetical protein